MLVRFPSWRAPRRSAPPIIPEAVTDYPELADDISTVDQVVTPPSTTPISRRCGTRTATAANR